MTAISSGLRVFMSRMALRGLAGAAASHRATASFSSRRETADGADHELRVSAVVEEETPEILAKCAQDDQLHPCEEDDSQEDGRDADRNPWIQIQLVDHGG